MLCALIFNNYALNQYLHNKRHMSFKILLKCFELFPAISLSLCPGLFLLQDLFSCANIKCLFDTLLCGISCLVWFCWITLNLWCLILYNTKTSKPKYTQMRLSTIICQLLKNNLHLHIWANFLKGAQWIVLLWLP